MFDVFHNTYKKIISCVGIVGYLEDEIIKRGINIDRNLNLNCLYAFPNKESSGMNHFTYQMMFPDNNHQIPCPKFFSLTLTDQQAKHTYLYCLKFSEKYLLKLNDKKKTEKKIEIPIVIFINSEKEDLECFRNLMNLINFIIDNDDFQKDGIFKSNYINDYKKVQLMNLFYFLFSLPHTSPHTEVKLDITKEIINSPIESIDFYFSSNCEIPCNKNDTDINILFLVLDQSIIIKVLFAILTEKQIVFRASHSYILHLIITTFLKLIFPFKWRHSCITVLPKENLDLLESPGSLIFGILSNIISLTDLMREYPGKVVVDCDTNEIFGDISLVPFEPPQCNQLNTSASIGQNKRKKTKKWKKDKKDKENKETTNYINTGANLTQGHNLIQIGGSYLYQYEEANTKKNKLKYTSSSNIIIDTEKSQLLIDKTNIFIDSREWKWLRKNIQLVRNPEIFDLENINNKSNKKLDTVFLNDENEEKVVLPNRSFSYNIQNILMKYLLNKISNKESRFMSIFQGTHLYLSYIDPRKYENNSGKKIIENILELKTQKRTFDNCFNIEYSLPKFKAKQMINKINKRINEITHRKSFYSNNNNEKKILDQIKDTLINYNQIRSEEDQENSIDYESLCESTKIDRKSNLLSINSKDISEGRKTEMKKPFLSRFYIHKKGHERIKTCSLQETVSVNSNFTFTRADTSSKGGFKFYGSGGFLEFINNFENFTKKSNIDIKEELYEQKIFEQIIDIISTDEDLFGKTNKNLENSTISANSANTKSILQKTEVLRESKLQKLVMSIIPEKEKEEEDENDKLQGKGTTIQETIEKESGVDSKSNLMNNNKQIGERMNLDSGETITIENKLVDIESKCTTIDDNIISFPCFNNGQEKEKGETNDNIINEGDKEKEKEKEESQVNHKSQYYLFIALILEEIRPNKEKSDKLIEIINKEKELKLNMKSLILKLYRMGYKYSGVKHRDFPYFSYYSFLVSIALDELKLLNEEFNDLTDKETELYEIYGNVMIEKIKATQNEEKKKQKKEIAKEENTSGTRSRKNSKKNSIGTNERNKWFDLFSKYL